MAEQKKNSEKNGLHGEKKQEGKKRDECVFADSL